MSQAQTNECNEENDEEPRTHEEISETLILAVVPGPLMVLVGSERRVAVGGHGARALALVSVLVSFADGLNISSFFLTKNASLVNLLKYSKWT